MLHNSDRFAQSDCRRLKVGDRARFPLDRLGADNVYRHSWELVAFGAGQSSFGTPGLAHTCHVRRLADGRQTQISQFWFARYQI